MKTWVFYETFLVQKQPSDRLNENIYQNRIFTYGSRLTGLAKL